MEITKIDRERVKTEVLEHKDNHVSLSEKDLEKDAKLRAKEQPLLQRIMKFLTRENSIFRELIINSSYTMEKRVALLSNGIIERFEIEREDDDRMGGAIFKGKIQNLEPGLKAAFVDIGQEKNAFLHYWDIVPSSYASEQDSNDHDIEIVRTNKKKDDGKKNVSMKDIPTVYPIGTEIVVQIIKTQIGSKGPRVTTNLSIPGRYLVLYPYSGQCGISRKISDPKERDRLKKIVHGLTLPPGMGIIIRTASEGKKLRYFVRDLHILLKKWDEIQEKIKNTKKPTLVYQEPDIIDRTVRDFLTEEVDRVLIDDSDDYERIISQIEQISPRSKSKIKLFTEDIPIFERFSIENQIEQLFSKEILLPSGGRLVIEETEALTSIDVNTGAHKNSGAQKGEPKDSRNTFIFQVNKEAAKEIARQLCLRNIGGLIVIDFIDMLNFGHKRQLLEIMRSEMKKDKAKVQILPISQFGIMQITRQRHSESILSGQYTKCPYCAGKSIVRSPKSVSMQIQRQLIYFIHKLRKMNRTETLSLTLFVNSLVLEKMKQDEQMLMDIEKKFDVKLLVKASTDYHIENFKIIDDLKG